MKYHYGRLSAYFYLLQCNDHIRRPYMYTLAVGPHHVCKLTVVPLCMLCWTQNFIGLSSWFLPVSLIIRFGTDFQSQNMDTMLNFMYIPCFCHTILIRHAWDVSLYLPLVWLRLPGEVWDWYHGINRIGLMGSSVQGPDHFRAWPDSNPLVIPAKMSGWRKNWCNSKKTRNW